MCRKNVCEKTPPVCCADSPLWDGAFGITAQFPAQAQSLLARQRLPPRGSRQNRQVLTEGVQAVTPSVCSLRSQPAPPGARLCAATAKLPATTEAVPLGKVASPQAMTEGVQPAKPCPQRRRFRRKQARQLPFAVTTPLVKKGFLKSPQTFQKPKI